MNSPTHFAIGGAICRYTRCKPLGFVLALASHFVLDALPHLENYGLFSRRAQRLVEYYWPVLFLAAQLLVLPVATVALWRLLKLGKSWRAALVVVAGGLFACLPDALGEFVSTDTALGRLNELTHAPWRAGLRLVEHGAPQWLPLVAAIMVLTETAALATGLRFLLRRDARGAVAETPSASP